MNGKLRTHEEFVEEMRINIPTLRIVSQFERTDKKILVEDKYGVCNVYPAGLLIKRNPIITSAVNKTSYFKNKAEEVHGNKYDYSKTNYIRGDIKIIVTCKKHGDFLVTPQNHLAGSNCPSCGREHTTEVAKQNTTSWGYKDWDIKGKKSAYFDCFKIYIAKLSNKEESFYKVGKTFNTVTERYRASKLPYKLEIIYEFCNDAHVISRLEEKLKRINKEHKYLPFIKFGGMHECFSSIQDLERIIQDPTYWDKIK